MGSSRPCSHRTSDRCLATRPSYRPCLTSTQGSRAIAKMKNLHRRVVRLMHLLPVNRSIQPRRRVVRWLTGRRRVTPQEQKRAVMTVLPEM